MTEETKVTEPEHDSSVATQELFARQEIVQFGQDDRQAGSAIGKMLALFFFYTVIAMTFVGLWTWYVTQK